MRNRIKRVLREAYRLNEGRFVSGWDFVLIGRGPLPELVEREGLAGVEARMIEVFAKASLLSESQETHRAQAAPGRDLTT